MPIRITSLLFALVVIAAYSVAGIQNEIKIIANPNVGASEISRDDLSRIFLMTKTSLSGAPHVEPVLEKAGTVHQQFLKEYIGRSDSALTTYYLSLMFTGKAAIPKSFASDAAVAAYVAKTKGAIGYVALNTNAAGVKTLTVR